MPLSRLWAAANTAKGDVAVFRDEVGSLPAFWSTFQLRPLLAHHDRRSAPPTRLREAWETTIFDPDQAFRRPVLLERPPPPCVDIAIR